MSDRKPADRREPDRARDAGHAMDAQLDLMDRQILDVDGRMVAKVDDVELDEREDGRLAVSALLTGPGALGPRLGGAVGSIVSAAWARLACRPADQPTRIDVSAVSEYSTVIRLALSRRAVQVDGFEVWLRERVITAIPGAGEDPE